MLSKSVSAYSIASIFYAVALTRMSHSVIHPLTVEALYSYMSGSDTQPSDSTVAYIVVIEIHLDLAAIEACAEDHNIIDLSVKNIGNKTVRDKLQIEIISHAVSAYGISAVIYIKSLTIMRNSVIYPAS